ncbi:MAG: DUF459 domain-containing protein [Pseudorhodoplanes sp.]
MRAFGLSRGLSLAAAIVAELAAVFVVCLAFGQPAAAQGFFDERYPFWQPDRWRRSSPPQSQADDDRPPDFSRAPAPKKPETPPTSTIMVFGDAMADWLAYGLEDAFSDTPEIGIVRKHKTYSGLIRYEARRDSPDWAQVARETAAAEKPNFIVMMIGVADRQAIREAARPAAPAHARNAPAGSTTPPAPREGATEQKTEPQAGEQKADAKTDTKQEQDAEQQPVIAAPEPAGRGGRTVSANHEYRSEKWEELYIKRIDDTIAALKSSGVPVYWVGLPPLRGTRSTSDMQYLNDLYRNRAEKAGIAYIEVWDGFVDENGRFTVQGPDFEGQIRRLRTSDGVYFTKAGARTLAHYVEREIRRDVNRVIPPVAAVPAPEEAAPQNARGASAAIPAAPATPAARPLVGAPVLLNATPSDSETLLGGSAPRPVSDGAAARVLVKGEPAVAAAGRADDFSWPPRAPNAEFAGPLPASPPIAVAATKPAQQQPAAPVRQAATAPQQARPPQPQYARPSPGPYWRSSPSWGSSWGGGGGGFFGLFRGDR